MHHLKDAELSRTLALPAAGATASSEAIDLRAPLQNQCHFEADLAVPALANLAEAATLTVTLEDSADGENFAAIPGLAPLVVTGGSGGGAEAVSRRDRLPRATRRHLRATAEVEAGGGDNTGDSLVLELVF